MKYIFWFKSHSGGAKTTFFPFVLFIYFGWGVGEKEMSDSVYSFMSVNVWFQIIITMCPVIIQKAEINILTTFTAYQLSKFPLPPPTPLKIKNVEEKYFPLLPSMKILSLAMIYHNQQLFLYVMSICLTVIIKMLVIAWCYFLMHLKYYYNYCYNYAHLLLCLINFHCNFSCNIDRIHK